MSKRIIPITVSEFVYIVNFAQKIHLEKNEPIPCFHNSKINELESCLQTPFMGFGGNLFYRRFPKKAAILFYLLARNHVLANGNKRVACLCLFYFCARNGYKIAITQRSLYHLARFTVLAPEENKDKTLKKIESTLRSRLFRITPAYS